MAIDLNVKNAQRIAEINTKVAELISKGSASPTGVVFEGVKIAAQDVEVYRTLIQIREVLSKDVGDKLIYDFGDIAYAAEDDVKIVYLYNEGGTGLSIPKSISKRGFIPGLGIAAPLPKQDGESILDYENYLKQYYKNLGIEVGVDSKTGIREEYPHEKYKWVNGRACVPRPEEHYVDEHYQTYRNSQLGNTFFNGARRMSQSQGQPTRQNNGPSRSQAQQTSARTQNGQPQQPGTGQPNPNRVTAPSGRTRFRRRTLQRAPEDKHGFFDRIFGAIYDFDKAAASPNAVKNYKKILKVVGVVLGVGAIVGLGAGVLVPLLATIIDSIVKSFAIASAPQIGAGIAKLVVAGLGVTLGVMFAKYIKRRKAAEKAAGEPPRSGDGDGEGTNPPSTPGSDDEPTVDPTSFTDPAQLVAYIKNRMAKFNAELAALDAEEMNLKNPGPISQADQDRINKKRALIQEGRNQLMDILMAYKTNVDINTERVMGGR